jgi:hypothetical protein
MSKRMKTILGLASMVGLTATVASAATWTTPSFPGLFVTTGYALCTATNVGTADALVKYELFDDYGFVLASNEHTLPPGRTLTGAVSNLANSSPSYCRFRYGGRVRASFDYVGGGTAVMVIPATK